VSASERWRVRATRTTGTTNSHLKKDNVHASSHVLEQPLWVPNSRRTTHRVTASYSLHEAAPPPLPARRTTLGIWHHPNLHEAAPPFLLLTRSSTQVSLDRLALSQAQRRTNRYVRTSCTPQAPTPQPLAHDRSHRSRNRSPRPMEPQESQESQESKPQPSAHGATGIAGATGAETAAPKPSTFSHRITDVQECFEMYARTMQECFAMKLATRQRPM